MFNATQPAPSQVYLGGRPPISRFIGVAPSAILEYTLPPAGGGGTTSGVIQSRALLTAERGSAFRGLAVSQWTPVPTPSATSSATATASSSATATSSSSASATSSASASATSTATMSAEPSQTVTRSVTASRTPAIYNSGLPTFSAAPTSSAQPSADSTSTARSTESASSTLTPTPSATSSLSVGASPSQTATVTPTASPSSTTSFVNATGGAAMAAGGTDNEGLKVGFGIAVPLLILGVSGFVLFSLFKSGKLMIMLKSTPKYFKHGYGKQTYNSARAPRVPMNGHPALRMNPLTPPNTQMSYNTKILDQMRSQKASMRQLVENQSVMVENGARTIIKTRVSFAPSLSTAKLPVSPSVGTSV